MTRNSENREDSENPDPVVGSTKPRLLEVLGPGLITGASDDDPSGIATYSQAGAQFGYSLSWSLLVSLPLMIAVQLIAARLGRVTGGGLAENISRHYPGWLLPALVLLVVTANVVNIGADLGAMGDSVALVFGGPRWLWLTGFGVASVLLQVFMQYARYVAVLKWLTLALLAYAATLFMVHVPWGSALKQIVVPHVQWKLDYLTTIVAVLGTTISPYLLFWQASQEVEDIRTLPRRKPLRRAPSQGETALKRIELDTVIGMVASNLIALAILFTAAATLGVAHVTKVESSAQAAEALRPIAGAYASAVFALGVVGSGILATPVLAGSAAYAMGEAFGWRTGLSREPLEARAFYGAIVAAMLLGVVMNFAPINPIRALYWSAVINGVAAAPVIAVMMMLASKRSVMGEFPVRGWLAGVGWTCMAAMGLAAAVMIAASLL